MTVHDKTAPVGGLNFLHYGELFRWESFEAWVNRAALDFKRHGVKGEHCICLDQLGHICTRGKQFIEARDRNLFPIVCYLVDPV
jgi:hypothetical protein